MPNFKLKPQFQIIWACFALHNYIRRIYSTDVNILQQFENISDLEDIEKDNEDHNDHSNPSQVEWEEPTQEDVRVMEEMRNSIRDQLSQQMHR